MSSPYVLSESRTFASSESPLLHRDPSFATTMSSRRSKWEWISLILRASVMFALTLAFVSASVMTIMIFDSAGPDWTWSDYAKAWGLVIGVALADLLLIFITVRLLRQIFPNLRPSNRRANCRFGA